jgi:hypothetical protein
MKLFLLIYDRKRGVLVETREYPGEQRKEALRARFEAEDAHRGDEDLEVVLLGAASFADIQKTHSRYFRSATELLHEASG